MVEIQAEIMYLVYDYSDMSLFGSSELASKSNTKVWSIVSICHGLVLYSKIVDMPGTVLYCI